MTIKTLEGTITAPKSILNVLSIGYAKLAESYEEDNLIYTATLKRNVSNQIFSALDKAGYYDHLEACEEEEEPESVNGLKIRRVILMDDVRSMCIHS